MPFSSAGSPRLAIQGRRRLGSARDGADRGYYMVCAADACATYTGARHGAALKAFGGYCRVQSVAEILKTIVARQEHDPTGATRGSTRSYR